MLKLTSPVKYHYFHRFLTYSVGRSACPEGFVPRRSRCSRAKCVRVAWGLGRSPMILPRDSIRGLSGGKFDCISKQHAAWDFAEFRWQEIRTAKQHAAWDFAEFRWHEVWTAKQHAAWDFAEFRGQEVCTSKQHAAWGFAEIRRQEICTSKQHAA